MHTSVLSEVLDNLFGTSFNILRFLTVAAIRYYTADSLKIYSSRYMIYRFSVLTVSEHEVRYVHYL